MMSRLVVFNKPYQVMSQFSAIDNKPTLARYIDIPGVYPAGRLDYDSEGLLLLTDDGALQHRISSPEFKLPKTYLAQVEGKVDRSALVKLRRGVDIKGGRTRPARAEIIDHPSWLWERTPPIRYRANIPTSWLRLEISEGRNRQVRRMAAAVGFPCLRLVRVAIGDWSLQDLQPGEFRLETVN